MKNVNSMLGLSPELRSVLAGVGDSGLPPIRGTWYVVDPYKTTSPEGGVEGAYADLQTAYAQCTTNAGDGILVLGSHATTTYDTSYQKSPLVWSKNGITVVGACAPTAYGQRARVTNKIVTYTASTISFTGDHTISDSASGFLTAGLEAGQYLQIQCAGSETNDMDLVAEGGSADFVCIDSVTAGTITTKSTSKHVTTQAAAAAGEVVITSYNWHTLKVTGANNTFTNLQITNSDNTAYALDAVFVSGARNCFVNCHIGQGTAGSAAVLARALTLSACEENTFRGCVFGISSYDRGNNATYDILLTGAVANNRFYDCETIRSTTVGVACFAVAAISTSGGRPTLFKNCTFMCWSSASGNANQSFAGVASGNNDFVWFDKCTYPGYAALSNDSVFWITGSLNSEAAGLAYS
jgi:hypothetical protein